MRPKITCHMVTSLDGRLYPDRWCAADPDALLDIIHRQYDLAAEALGGEGWIVGRKTMADYVGSREDVDLLPRPRPRDAFVGDRAGRNLAVGIDPAGRLGFASDEVDGDHAVAMLGERVSEPALARLRELGVSYVFAGPDGRDLARGLDALGEALGVRHLFLQGGGVINGAFLAAGLIDEVSTLIAPAIDGLAGVPAIFEHAGASGSRPAAGRHLELLGSEVLEGGLVWLRHRVVQSS